VKSVTLVKLVQLGVGAKNGTQCPNLGNYINGMIGMDKQIGITKSATGAWAKYWDTPKYENC